MTTERMFEIAEEMLGGEIKWCDDKKLNEIFEAVKKETGGNVNISWLKVQNAISNDLVFPDAIWAHFTDEQMLKLYKSRLGDELETGKYKTNMNMGTMFHPAQSVLGHAPRLGYNQTLEYFMKHVDIDVVDFDRLMVLSAINTNNEKALELILEHANENYKTQGGKGNAFFYRIKAEVNDTLLESKISDKLKHRMASEFSWIEPVDILARLEKKWSNMDTTELLAVDVDSLDSEATILYQSIIDKKLADLKSRLAKLQAS